MNSIGILIYSYKGRLIKDVVNNIISNKSGLNKINIYIAEQHPLIKDEYFANFEEVNYRHIFWDHPYGMCDNRQRMINESSEDYILMISDNVILKNNWDTELINLITDETIISGLGELKISQPQLFYLNKTYTNSDYLTKSYFVDSRFIFAKRDVFLTTHYPAFLKYRGESEYLSIYWYTQGRDVYSAPSYIADIVGDNSLDTLYVPFSIHHNYNAVVDSYHQIENHLIKLKKVRSIDDFIQYHNIDLKRFIRLPFQTNDVEYDCYNNKFDKLDGRKFMGSTRAIY